MSDETKQEEQKAEEAIETGGTFAEQVSRLSNDQLQAVKQVVNTEAGKREQPDYANMGDGEFRDQVRKRFGYSPRS